MRRIIGIYDDTTLELSKLDVQNAPTFPVIRFCDRDKLIGIFSIETGEIVLDNDMTEFEYLFAEKEIRINRDEFLQSWHDYVKFLADI